MDRDPAEQWDKRKEWVSQHTLQGDTQSEPTCACLRQIMGSDLNTDTRAHTHTHARPHSRKHTGASNAHIHSHTHTHTRARTHLRWTLGSFLGVELVAPDGDAEVVEGK